MSTILVASTNRGKVREIRAFLEGLPFAFETLAEHPGFPVFPETGRTFEENARGKGLFYGRLSGGLVLAEDSGLEVDRLGGAPGVISARFSDPGATDDRNIDKVLELLADAPPSERTARFVCCLVLCRGEDVLKEIRGTVEGTITTARRGSGGFGYDPIFYYPPLGRTFGELSPEEKNRVSHRGNALRQLREFLSGPDGSSSFGKGL
jgi:XTP/dITP diphosphohydrolase